MTQQTVTTPASNVIGGVCFLTSGALLILSLIGTIHVAWWVIALPIFVYFGLVLFGLLLAVTVGLIAWIILSADKRSKRKSVNNYRIGR